MTETAPAESRTDVDPPTGRVSAVWLRTMARLYDPFVWWGEAAGMRRRRSGLLRGAHGRVVEIGAGTGLNVAHYPADVSELLLTEPEPGMRGRLARRLQRHGRVARIARIVDAPAECLPMADESVDTVVSTLVLCTVEHPEHVLREIARVLRHDGQLLFIEHVRASRRFTAACQEKLLEPWRHFAGGCVCNRRTAELMRSCGFTIEAEDATWRGMPAIVHPLIVGRATPPPSRPAR
jgi:SAM-dependent methyltransferase